MPAGRTCRAQGDPEGLHGTSECAAGRGLRLRDLRFDGFGCEAAVLGDLQKPGSGEVHGGERGLLQAHTLKPSKLPQLSVHASALAIPNGHAAVSPLNKQ